MGFNADSLAPLLTPTQTAEILGVSPAALEAWRSRGITPPLPFCKVGRLVRYRPSDVSAWVSARTHVTTTRLERVRQEMAGRGSTG